MDAHKHDIRIYYEDTDMGGIVYYANYLKFCERARTESLRSMGISNTALKEEDDVFLVIRHVEADYLGSARLDDLITVETGVGEVRNASFVMNQAVFCQNKLIFAAKVAIACVTKDIKATKMPKKLKDALQSA